MCFVERGANVTRVYLFHKLMSTDISKKKKHVTRESGVMLSTMVNSLLEIMQNTCANIFFFRTPQSAPFTEETVLCSEKGKGSRFLPYLIFILVPVQKKCKGSYSLEIWNLVGVKIFNRLVI